MTELEPIKPQDVPPEDREPLIALALDIFGEEAADELRQALYPN